MSSFVIGLAAPKARPVVGEDLETRDVVDDLAGTLCGGTAGVVADHPAERAVRMRGGFWPVGKVVRAQAPC